jgi:hypothetical protein
LFCVKVVLCYATLPAFQMQTLRPSRSISWQLRKQRQAQAYDPTPFKQPGIEYEGDHSVQRFRAIAEQK